MSLTPPQYKQMKQFLESDQRTGFYNAGLVTKGPRKGEYAVDTDPREYFKTKNEALKFIKDKKKGLFKKTKAGDKFLSSPKFKELYQSFEGGKDLEFANFLNEQGYLNSIGKPFNESSVFKRRTDLGLKTKSPIGKFLSKQEYLKQADDLGITTFRGKPISSYDRKTISSVISDKKKMEKRDPKKKAQYQKKYAESAKGIETKERYLMKRAMEQKLLPPVKGGEQLLWKDLFRDAQRYREGRRLKFVNNRDTKKFGLDQIIKKDEMLNASILDTKTGKVIKFGKEGILLKQYIQNNTPYSVDQVLKPYYQKSYANSSGITEATKKLIPNTFPGDKRSFFQIQHDRGRYFDPFKVSLGTIRNNVKENVIRERFEKIWNKNLKPDGTIKVTPQVKEAYKNFKTEINKLEGPIKSQPQMISRERFFGKEQDFKSALRDLKKEGVEYKKGTLKGASEVEKKLIATLSKDPRCQIRGFKNQGGRVGLQDGSASLNVCFRQGVDNINRGLPNPTAAQARNFGKVAAFGRNVVKFGILPEALFLAGESVLRAGMGDTLPEAILRASEYLLPLNQTKLADRMMLARTVGPKTAELILKANELRGFDNQIQNLENEKQFTGILTDDGFDDNFFGQTKVEQENAIQNQIDALKKRRESYGSLTESQFQFADMQAQEAEDIKTSRALFPKLLAKARSVDIASDDPLKEGIKETINLDLKMLPSRFDRQFNLDARDPIFDQLVNTTDQELSNRYTGQTLEDLKNYRDHAKFYRTQTVSEAAALNPEAMFSASTGQFAPPIDLGVSYTPPPIDTITEMEREITGQTNLNERGEVINPFDIDRSSLATGLRGFAAAGGGIAKLAGKPSGPPPTSGPTSQGLPGLLKRDRRI